MYKKIAIIGNAGSGKSVMAKKLSALLNLPLHHLDQYYFFPGWERKPKEEFKKIHDDVCNTDSWVIEGCMIKVVPYRMEQADMIIYLRISRARCIWNIIKRLIFMHGKSRDCVPAGCIERFDIKFFKFFPYVWNFNKKYDNHIKQMLSAYVLQKPVYVFSSYEQIDEFVALIKRE